MIIAGRYEVLEKIAAGGMGIVYLARHRELDRVMAVKMLAPNLTDDTDVAERFLREARVLARLKHPNIVQVYDFGRAEGECYLAMEYIEGANLRELLATRLKAEGHPLPINEVARIGSDIASALAYTHDTGLIHRDIKPSNILVEKTGRVVVTDFGIARLLEGAETTQTGHIVGSLRYCSPEQFQGRRDLDGRADIYGLGLILYELSAGRAYFSAASDNEMLRVLIELRRNVVALDDVPAEWSAILERAIAVDRDQRYLQADELQRDLDVFRSGLGHDPIFARVPAALGESAAPVARPASIETTGAVLREMAEPPRRDVPVEVAQVDIDATGAWTPVAARRGVGSIISGWMATARGLIGGKRPIPPPAQRPASAAPPPPPIHQPRTIEGQPAPRPALTPSGTPTSIPAQAPRATPPIVGRADEGDHTRIAAKPPAVRTPVERPSAARSSPMDDATSIFSVPPGVSPANASERAPAAGLASLTIVRCEQPQHVGSRVQIAQFPFVIGRGHGCGLSVPDVAVSRQHAAIDHEQRGFFVRDLGTLNGTFVDGRRVNPERDEVLLFGSRIMLGSGTELLFSSEAFRELPSLTGQRIADRYLLEESIHASAKASVYTAIDQRFERAVVIKVLTPGLANHPGYRAQFEREAHLASRLSHPAICRILDYGTTRLALAPPCESLFVCMELMEGGNLSRRIADGRTFEIATVAAWVDRLGDALDYVHGKGIIHGGLKPSAVVFDASDHPYLTDFALATKTGDTDRRQVFGAPAFLAPEQWSGADPQPATDQYSLAVLVYQLLTSKLPYEGQERPDIREVNFVRGPIPAHDAAARHGRPTISPAVSEVVGRALATDPTSRHGSMRELATAFRAALSAGTAAPATPGVFMSYHRKSSAPWALLLKRELEREHGCRVFVDVEQRDAAGRFPAKLERQVQRCDVFVCLLSDETLASEWVRRELEMAVSARKPMVPVFQESFRLPADADAIAPCFQELLAYDGVKLLDLQGVYIDAAVRRLGEAIRELLVGATH